MRPVALWICRANGSCRHRPAFAVRSVDQDDGRSFGDDDDSPRWCGAQKVRANATGVARAAAVLSAGCAHSQDVTSSVPSMLART